MAPRTSRRCAPCGSSPGSCASSAARSSHARRSGRGSYATRDRGRSLGTASGSSVIGLPAHSWGRWVTTICSASLVPSFGDRPELGFALVPRAHGKGLAGEAARGAVGLGGSDAAGRRDSVHDRSRERRLGYGSPRVSDTSSSPGARNQGGPMILLSRRSGQTAQELLTGDLGDQHLLDRRVGHDLARGPEQRRLQVLASSARW